MGLERPGFGVQPGLHAFRLDPAGQLPGLFATRSELEPDHARQRPPFEGANLTQLELETEQSHVVQPAGDALYHRTIGRADEADGQVQVVSGRPPKLRRHSRTQGEVLAQLFAPRFGHRQPEEGADASAYLRAGAFCQCSGTHELGAVGRHP